MTISIKFLSALMIIIFLSSSTLQNPNEIIGTYEVSASDPSRIKLTIDSDNSFYFQDFSQPDNKIVVKGNWTLKGEKVFLMSSNSNIKFHNVWTILNNGKVVKSHKGLTFYRLSKIKG